MEFKSSEPTENFIFREISENEIVEIGVYPVLFGFRVRAGFIKNDFFHIDWCCGNNQFVIERMFTILKLILEKREEDAYCFRLLLPNSKIKPFYNDPDFVIWLSKYIPENLKEQKLPDLHILKNELFKELFSSQ